MRNDVLVCQDYRKSHTPHSPNFQVASPSRYNPVFLPNPTFHMTQPSSEYTAQLQQKAGYLKQRFAEFSPPEWQVFASPEKHYRMRAEFRVWHEGEHISYAMFEPGQKAGSASLRRIDSLPRLPRSMP